MSKHSAFAFLALALSVLPASAQNQVSQSELIAALRGGGHVIIFRHGATHPDQADTDPLNHANVDKQRQLNDNGRAVARDVGAAFRKLQIPVGAVYTSMFHRAIETAKLGDFGEVKPSADVTEGGLVVSPNENNRRAQAMRKLVSTAPPTGTKYRHRVAQAQHHGRVRQGLVRYP